MKKIIALLILASMLVFAFAACDEKAPETTDDTTVSSDTTAAEENNDTPDLTKPEVVIELGDYEGMSALCKKIQNMEMANKVVQITGKSSNNFSSASIMQRNEADNESVGYTYKIEGLTFPEGYPEDGAVITVTGVVVTEGFVSYISVLPENLTAAAAE